MRRNDESWRGVPETEHIIYELHVGTFTAAGTWRAAAAELPELARLGVTTVEMLPIADFPGRFGWGYDGVNLFAPTRLYGEPDNLKFFINEAHRLGLAVLLDVVYNHFGPDGNYLTKFSAHYFSEKYKNEWGEAPNFDDANSQPVRDFVLANVAYWIAEFHFDGLRLDATQNIYDASPKHLLAEIAKTARAAGGGAGDFHHRGERAPGNEAGAAGGCGRLRPRRDGQRRFPSLGAGRADRAQRGVLQRPPRRAAGIRLVGQARVPVPRAAL